MTKIVVSGKRKSAIARAVLTDGSGTIRINNRDYKNFHEFDKLSIEEPLRIYEHVIGKPNFDVEITVRGGGDKGQIEAARLALARAMNNFAKSKKLEEAFTEYDRNLLIADVRRKETYKPMDSKARAKKQSYKK